MKGRFIIIVVLAIYAISLQQFSGIPETKAISTTEAARIDLYTQKEPYSGRGPNQPSDAFAPEERVHLYANVTYNFSPLDGKTVTFEIKIPTSAQSTVLVLTSSTNSTGIATVSFAISVRPETAVFGVWNVYASVNIAEAIATDELTFQVGWLIEITSLRTLNKTLQAQAAFMQGTCLIAELTLKNIAMKPLEATLVVGAIDPVGHVLNTAIKSNTTVNPLWNYTHLKFQIPKWATLGEAKLYSGAYTALPSLEGTSYCPEVTTTFRITLLGDLNGDGVVDTKDLAIVALAFGTYPVHPRWNPAADLDQDDKSDIKDIALVAGNFGKTEQQQ